MEFPKGYIQERDNYRVNENERKLHNFLRDYFAKAMSMVVSGVRYYLFNKTQTHSSDKFQVGESIQVSAHSNAASISLLRTQGTEAAPSATTASTLGSVRGVGYDGSSYAVGASYNILASQNWSAGAKGSYLVFSTVPNGTTVAQDSGFISPSGSWASGTGSLATTATSGFLYIPTCAGVPTGVPESITGRIPLVADTSGGKIYAYLGGWTALN